MGKDYYKILGVSKDADDDAIKKAYKKQGKYRLSVALTGVFLNTVVLTLILCSFKVASRPKQR